MLFRLLMLRPHPLSLGLLVLLFALLQDARAGVAGVVVVSALARGRDASRLAPVRLT